MNRTETSLSSSVVVVRVGVVVTLIAELEGEVDEEVVVIVLADQRLEIGGGRSE